jgi:hypothetical protein
MEDGAPQEPELAEEAEGGISSLTVSVSWFDASRWVSLTFYIGYYLAFR